jgi:hypothetical protein
MDAIDFLSALYDPVPRDAGVIDMRLLKNGDAVCISRTFTFNPEVIRDTLRRWSDPDSNTGVYYGVALRNPGATRGTKADIAVIPALWTDIDVVKMGWDMDRTIAALKSMPVRPSALVHSGNGLHAYWALKTPIVLDEDAGIRHEQTVSVEKTMKRLAEIVGGDRTFDITRVLRVPGTWNTKGEKAKAVKVLMADWTEYDFEALAWNAKETDGFLENGDWLTKEQFTARAKAAKADKATSTFGARLAGEAGISERALDIPQIWNLARAKGGERGSAFFGLDEAMLRHLAVSYARQPGWTEQMHIDEAMNWLRRTMERDGVQFNEPYERRKAKDKLDRFVQKWDARRKAESVNVGRRK